MVDVRVRSCVVVLPISVKRWTRLGTVYCRSHAVESHINVESSFGTNHHIATNCTTQKRFHEDNKSDLDPAQEILYRDAGPEETAMNDGDNSE